MDCVKEYPFFKWGNTGQPSKCVRLCLCVGGV